MESERPDGDPRIAFVASTPTFRVAFGPSLVLITSVEGSTHTSEAGTESAAPEGNTPLTITFENARRVAPQGQGSAGPVTNYLIGSDSSKWLVGASTYGELAFPDLYDGVDLVFGLTEEGLKYEFRLERGIDAPVIRVHVGGAKSLALDEVGRLTIESTWGLLHDGAPISSQVSVEVDCKYRLFTSTTFGFACNGLNGSEPLVIDPLIYSTFIGGSDLQAPTSVALDAAGSAYVAGFTRSADFPVSIGALNETYSGEGDVFVAKLNPSGTALEYATYVGGSGWETAASIAVNSIGEVFIGGNTKSMDFPTTPGSWHTAYRGGYQDGFVVRLNASGSGLVYSTYLGGIHDSLKAVALGADNSLYLVGDLTDPDFPTTDGAFSRLFNNGSANGSQNPQDAFVARLSATGDALLFSTFVGGNGSDTGTGVTVDAQANVWITGGTGSADFPMGSGALYYPTNVTGGAFATLINASGDSLLHSSLLSGSQGARGVGISAAPGGGVIVLGYTNSQDLPTTPGCYQPGPGNTGYYGTADAFVAKFDAGGALAYSTYLGGPLEENPLGLAVDSASNVYITGWTEALPFPMTANAFQWTFGGGAFDAFAAKLNSDGSALDYGTFFGGTRVDGGAAIAVDAAGDVILVGSTNSSDLPITPGAFDSSFDGTFAGFVTKLSIPSPTLFIAAPKNGTNASVPVVWVSGLTDAGVNLTVNGVRVDVAGNGSFGLAVALLPGKNVIMANATAPDGRSNAASVIVTFNDPVPGLLQQLAQEQARLNATRVSLNATIANLSNVSASLNATAVLLGVSQAQLNATQAQLLETQANVTAALLAINASAVEITRLEGEAAANASNLTAVRLELVNAQANLTRLSQQVVALTQELEQAKSSANATADEIESLRQQLASMQVALNRTSDQLNATNGSLNQTKSDLSATQAELEGLKGIVMAMAAGLVVAMVAVVVWAIRARRKRA